MPDDIPRPVLLVFVKYPEPGRVKTRLAAEIGPSAAADLYRDWIGTVLINLQPLRPRVQVVGYFAGARVDQFVAWDRYVGDWLEQPDGDLGRRLAAGFEWGHGRGRPVIAVGTDCLELTAGHVESAVDLLAANDVVFGPAADGGYYLVGTSRDVPGFFDGVRWSSPHTLADHQIRCGQLGMSVALLPTLADIDTAADWRAYQRRGGSP